MSSRIFLGFVMLTSLVAIFAIDVLATFFFERVAQDFFTISLKDDPIVAVQTLLNYQLIVHMGVGVLMAIIGFFFFSRFFSRPLRNLITTLQTYMDTGEYASATSKRSVLSEIKTLEVTTGELIEKIEAVHTRDVEASRVKSDFISTAAHQLRTPVTGIRWALEALMKEDLTENQKMLVENAVEKSKDLVSIIGTLLDISSIESGKYKYTFEQCSLQSLVAHICNDFIPLAQKASVTLSYMPSLKQYPAVRADTERITWVLNNLIENAIRYTPAGGSVQISLEEVPGRVQVHVRDTGIGIVAKDRNNIFERFYRAGNAVAKENKGSGLGLYIARTVATDHGGDLNFIQNPEGPGTTFILSLPTI